MGHQRRKMKSLIRLGQQTSFFPTSPSFFFFTEGCFQIGGRAGFLVPLLCPSAPVRPEELCSRKLLLSQNVTSGRVSSFWLQSLQLVEGKLLWALLWRFDVKLNRRVSEMRGVSLNVLFASLTQN